MTEGDAAVRRDADGIALGGVRTPPVDVPTRILSGEKGPSDEVICLLLGSTKPMTGGTARRALPVASEFEQRYDAAVDDAIEAGSVLEEDRDALLDFAHPELVTG